MNSNSTPRYIPKTIENMLQSAWGTLCLVDGTVVHVGWLMTVD